MTCHVPRQVLAERRQVRADTRIVALRLAMNADLAVVASLGWMNDRTRRAGSLRARYIRTADAPVMTLAGAFCEFRCASRTTGRRQSSAAKTRDRVTTFIELLQVRRCAAV